jgi:hypothetical protein
LFGLKILKFVDADSDPGSGIFLTLDPGWKNSDRLKILKFFVADPGIFLSLDPGWKNSDPGSGLNIQDPG